MKRENLPYVVLGIFGAAACAAWLLQRAAPNSTPTDAISSARASASATAARPLLPSPRTIVGPVAPGATAELEDELMPHPSVYAPSPEVSEFRKKALDVVGGEPLATIEKKLGRKADEIVADGGAPGSELYVWKGPEGWRYEATIRSGASTQTRLEPPPPVPASAYPVASPPPEAPPAIVRQPTMAPTAADPRGSGKHP